MPLTTQIASFRKVNAGILASAHLASQDDRPAVLKKDVSLILKRVAPALGIDGTAYHVLDILLGLVQTEDFNAGRRPVVAISNQRLAEYTRRTTRTVTRCLKKLVEAGILAYRDSPTGRRYVYRGCGGKQEQAYGFDFTPACFNLNEFKSQADAFQRRIKAEQEARRAITRYSRAIVDLADVGLTKHQEIVTVMHGVLSDVKLKAIDKAAALERIYDGAISKIEIINSSSKSCSGDIDVTPLPITNHPDLKKCNKVQTCSKKHDIVNLPKNQEIIDYALEIKPCAKLREIQLHKLRTERGVFTKQTVSSLEGVSISLIQSACTSIQKEIGVSLSNWHGLWCATEQLRILIGLSSAGFQNAVERQGKYLAAACLAVVAEKAMRDPDQISSPGGYFCAMIDRAVEGELMLNKSLYGLQQVG